jgi:DNA-binding MarR family transcriptional regulator
MTEPVEPHDVRMLAQLLERAQRALTAAERSALGPHHLTPGVFQLLDLAVRQGEVSPARAADMLGVSRPTVSGWIATLREAGLLERGGVDGDGRRAVVVATLEGRRVWKSASDAIRGRQLRLVAHAIDPNAQADLLEALARIAEAMPDGERST